MPLFKIEIILAARKTFIEFRDVPDVDLETYYAVMWNKAHKAFPSAIAQFEVSQISYQSHVAKHMKDLGLDRMVMKTSRC